MRRPDRSALRDYDRRETEHKRKMFGLMPYQLHTHIHCDAASAGGKQKKRLFRQAERLAEVQQEAYRLSNKQFEKGMISAIEYQSASQTYLNATAEKLNSLLKLYIKDAVVRYYGGEAYINQQNQ